jgi:hypothetical protein
MVEVMEQFGADFKDIIEAYEDHCLQSEIDQKIADLEAKAPKLPNRIREDTHHAIYEAAQIRAAIGSYPVTPELRRRLAAAAEANFRPVTHPALFGHVQTDGGADNQLYGASQSETTSNQDKTIRASGRIKRTRKKDQSNNEGTDATA